GKGLELIPVYDPSVPAVVRGDVTRLRQILVNLLSNAVKFTEDGEVVVSAAAELFDGGQVRLDFAVADTGVGIPTERIPALFEAFSQVDASTTRKYGGTGLGLAICRRLIDVMGGDVTVTSQVGQGTTFRFSVLCHIADDAPAVAIPGTENLFDRRVLLIEQGQSLRDAIARLLGVWGMHITACATFAEASAAMDRLGDDPDQRPELIVVGAGDRSAGELSQALDRLAGDIPRIALGCTDGDADEGTLSAVLSKPVRVAALAEAALLAFGFEVQRSAIEQLDLPTSGAAPLHILLVEDNVVNQKMALLMLERLGYKADLAANGIEALEALLRQTYDLILLDIQMPEMDGYETATHIVASYEPERRPYIVAMTANATRSARERCLEVGMNAFLPKPVRLEELAQLLFGFRSGITAAALPSDESNGEMHDDAFAQGSPFFDLAREIGAEAFSQLIDIFLADSQELVDAMRGAASASDTELLARSAHSLKGSSLNLGADELAALARRVEQEAKQGRTSAAGELLDHIDAELRRVGGALRAVH
ncbi:MAG: ATP-binding protein, partial [Myxococcota bacterium]